jgi:TRAP-type C4-dicarboxylate transport system substrate-binding protein
MGATIMQKKVWDQISPEIQELILSASREAELELTNEIRGLDDKAIEVMTEHGLVVHKVSDEELVAWREIAETVYPYIRGSLVPEAAFDRAIKLRDEFRLQQSPN